MRGCFLSSLLVLVGCNADGDGDINSSRNSDPVCSVGYQLVDGKCQPSPGSQGSGSTQIRDRLPKEEAKPNPSDSARRDTYLDGGLISKKDGTQEKVWSFTIDEDVSALTEAITNANNDTKVMTFIGWLKTGFLVDFEYDYDLDKRQGGLPGLKIENGKTKIKLMTELPGKNDTEDTRLKIKLAPQVVGNGDKRALKRFPQPVCFVDGEPSNENIRFAKALTYQDNQDEFTPKPTRTDSNKEPSDHEYIGCKNIESDKTTKYPSSPSLPADDDLKNLGDELDEKKSMATHIRIDGCKPSKSGLSYPGITISTENDKLKLEFDKHYFNRYENELLIAMLDKDKRFTQDMVNEKFVVNVGIRNPYNFLKTTTHRFVKQRANGENNILEYRRQLLGGGWELKNDALTELPDKATTCFNSLNPNNNNTSFSYQDYMNRSENQIKNNNVPTGDLKEPLIKPRFELRAADGCFELDKPLDQPFSLTQGSLKYFLAEIDHDLSSKIPEPISKSDFKKNMKYLIEALTAMIECKNKDRE